MAIIDVVKYQTVDGELCHKFESDDLRMGTQLVVHPAQTAFFVKGGAVCDEFTAGTYKLDTENIPILNKIINLPFGSDSPFQAEVWFVNQTAKLNLPWGTPHPIQIEDPRYHIILLRPDFISNIFFSCPWHKLPSPRPIVMHLRPLVSVTMQPHCSLTARTHLHNA